MMRAASQLTFCSPEEIPRRTVVEQDEQKQITRMFSLDENIVESAHTLFYDGILSSEIISVKKHTDELDKLVSDYHYIDLSGEIPVKIDTSGKPLIMDFGTESIEKVNDRLSNHAPALSTFSIYDIVAACCYYPALVLGLPASFSANRKTQILLWEYTDLINKRMTNQTRIKEIF